MKCSERRKIYTLWYIPFPPLLIKQTLINYPVLILMVTLHHSHAHTDLWNALKLILNISYVRCSTSPSFSSSSFYWRINTVRVDCKSTQAEEMPGCCKIWLTRKNDRPWPRPALWFSWTDPPQVLTNHLSRVRSCVTSEGRWCWKEYRKKDVSSAAFQGIYLCVSAFWTVFKDRGNKTRRKTEVHPNSWRLCWQFM